MPNYMERLRSNPLYEEVKAEIQELLTAIRDRISDGFQFRDLNPIVRTVISVASSITRAVDAQPGPRRQLFIDICTAAWEDQGKPIDLPWVPNFLEKRIVDPMIGSAIEFMAGVVYDYITEG